MLAWYTHVYPCCLARSKFQPARQSGGYDRYDDVLCDRRKLVVRSYGSNMAAAEAKLSFDLAVDSVLDSLEPKFILKERLALHSFITTKKDGEFLSLYIRHLV